MGDHSLVKPALYYQSYIFPACDMLFQHSCNDSICVILYLSAFVLGERLKASNEDLALVVNAGEAQARAEQDED